MERSFSARELVIMSSRLQWNTTLVTDIKNTVTALRPTDPTTLNTDTRDRIQSPLPTPSSSLQLHYITHGWIQGAGGGFIGFGRTVHPQKHALRKINGVHKRLSRYILDIL